MAEQLHTTTDPDAAALRRCVEAAAEGLFGGSPRAVVVDRHRLASSTSYETSVVTAEFLGGRKLRAFMKDFGSSVRPKDDPRLRREREMQFYRDLVPGGELGIPAYYASLWDEPRERHWLFLEFVEGTPVRYCDFDYWVVAAGWLGRMHGYFFGQLDRLAGCDALQRHDAMFFRSKAECSLHAVAAVSPRLGGRLADALAGYDGTVRVMTDQPRTLLHGGYRPVNVLVKVDGAPQRTCVIDWEEVGVGAPLSDLAYFVDGFDGPRLGLLLDAYCAAARPFDLPLPGRGEMIHVVNCFRLHKLVHSLQKYVQWNVPEATVAKLVGQVEQYARAAA